MADYIRKFNPFTKSLQYVLDSTSLNSLNFKPGVADFGSLPSSGNLDNDARIVNDTHHLYIWNGTVWVDQGDILDINWGSIGGSLTSQTDLQEALNNKLNSDDSDLLDAIAKKHTQNTDIGTTNSTFQISSIPSDRPWQLLGCDDTGMNIIAGTAGYNIGDGRLYISNDGGLSWTEKQPAGDIDKRWSCGCIADGGRVCVVGIYNGRIYISVDYGTTWVEKRPLGNIDSKWWNLDITDNGSFIIADSTNNYTCFSNDTGENWTITNFSGGDCKCDIDGSHLIVRSGSSTIKLSTDFGVNWIDKTVTGQTNMAIVAIANNGSYLFTADTNGKVFISSDLGNTWVYSKPGGISATDYFYDIACSSNGQYVVICSQIGRLYISSDYGVTWTEKQPAGDLDLWWEEVDCSNSGAIMIAATTEIDIEGKIYISTDYGVTWTTRSTDGGIKIKNSNSSFEARNIADTAYVDIKGKNLIATGNLSDGINEVSVANIKDAVDKRHDQNTDTILDEGGINEVSVANIKDAVDKRHDQNTDTILDEGGINEVSASQLKAIIDAEQDIFTIINGKLNLPATVTHTNTDPASLNIAIQALNDGDILEVNSSATYNPISIPANKALVIRSVIGKCIHLTGTECLKLMNGARDTLIANVYIKDCTSPAANERGAGISFGEHYAKVSNITFYQISVDNVLSGSGVMLSYHWSVGGDNYATPNILSECSNDVRFISCCFFKANKANTEGAALSLRGIINPYIYDCTFRDNALSMRQLQLQNCINASIFYNHIRNSATPGTNSEGIKLDDLGSCSYRSTGKLIGNIIVNAIEGIDIDDQVDALIIDNVCSECTEEGISVDDSATAVLGRNLCYNCRYDVNSAGIRVENGAVVTLIQNVCLNNITNYRIENGYTLPTSNTESIDDIVLRQTAKNLVYSGDISNSFNVKDALDSLYASKIKSEASGDWKKVTEIQFNSVTNDIRILYEN